MTTDPNIPPPGDRAGGEPAQGPRELRAALAEAIATAGDPAGAAEAVLGVLRGFGQPPRVGACSALADLLTATAAHLRGHPGLCEVTVNNGGALHLAVGEHAAGWAIADWADSVSAPVEFTPWPEGSGRDAAHAEIVATLPAQPHPVPVRVWDRLPGGAELLGSQHHVAVSPDDLRAWLANRAITAAEVAGGGERS